MTKIFSTNKTEWFSIMELFPAFRYNLFQLILGDKSEELQKRFPLQSGLGFFSILTNSVSFKKKTSFICINFFVVA